MNHMLIRISNIIIYRYDNSRTYVQICVYVKGLVNLLLKYKMCEIYITSGLGHYDIYV